MQNTVPATFKNSGAPVTPPAAEPQLPTCVDCGSSTGTLKPNGDRYPSGAQKFVCAVGCTSTPDELYTLWQGMTIGETAATPSPSCWPSSGSPSRRSSPRNCRSGSTPRSTVRSGTPRSSCRGRCRRSNVSPSSGSS